MLKQLLKPVPEREVPLLCDASPKYIWYADTPGNVPYKISITKFLELYTAKGNQPFHYTETVWYNPYLKKLAGLIDYKESYNEMRGQFIEMLLRPNIGSDMIYIAYTGPETGFGAFARQKIDWLTLLGVYAGIFSMSLGNTDSVYSLSSFNLHGVNISAERRGGWTRFIQQMPRSTANFYAYYRRIKETGITNNFYISGTLDQIINLPMISKKDFYKTFVKIAPKSIRLNDIDSPHPNIATNNLFHNFYIMDGLPLFVFYANRDIQPHEPLGIDYQKGYWHNKKPYFFNKKGNMLTEYVYCNNCSAVGPTLSVCGRCKTVSYCGVVCQRADWPRHKKICV